MYNKGNTLYHLGKYNQAIGYYDKVLAIDPNHVKALNNKGNSLAIDPKYYSALRIKGTALGKLKDKEGTKM